MNKDYKLYVHIAPNGKKYYGITKQDVKQRWANGKGYHHNQHFTNAINKYGWDNIEHIVLYEGLDEEEAKELEQYMIQWYDTANRIYGYNQSLGGEGSSGYTHTEEAKQKISIALKGKYTGENNPIYGKHLSKEHRQKISEGNKGKQAGEKHPMYGKHHTEEAKQKISAVQKGRDNNNAKSVICITTNHVFYTIIEGGNYYNIDRSCVSRCCAGKRKSAGKLPNGTKLVWRYIDIIEL
jgi:group I intron endonuclease